MFRREIRPARYDASIEMVQGLLTLIIDHPLEGDRYLYTLPEDMREKLHDGTQASLRPVPDPEPPPT